MDHVDFTHADVSRVVEWPAGYDFEKGEEGGEDKDLGLASSLAWRGDKIAIEPKAPNIPETDTNLFSRLIEAQQLISGELLESLERSNIDLRLLEKVRNYNNACGSSGEPPNVFHLDALYKTISAYQAKHPDEFNEVDRFHLDDFLRRHRALREIDADWVNFQIRTQSSEQKILDPSSAEGIASVLKDPASDIVIEESAQAQIIDEVEQPDIDVPANGKVNNAKYESLHNIVKKLVSLLKDPPKLAKNLEAIAKIRDLLGNILSNLS